MPFDSILPPSAADLSAAMQLRVRAALTGWTPRPTEPPGRLAKLRALLRRPLSDKGQSLCY